MPFGWTGADVSGEDGNDRPTGPDRPTGVPGLGWDRQVLAPPEPGDPAALGGYRLAGRLGAGGTGLVFLGLGRGGRAAAVKVVHPELAADAGFRDRLRVAVKAARDPVDPRIVPLIRTDPRAEPPWLAAEYVPGPDLASAVRTYGTLTMGAVRRLGADAADALAALHRSGRTHGGVKPGNLLLAADGAHLADCGLDRALVSDTLARTRIPGAPQHLAPEVLRSDAEPGPPADVFALAGVLVFALSGTGPFGLGPPLAQLYRVVHDDPNLSRIPAPLADLFEHCLAKDPAGRPTAAELAAGLRGPALGDGRLAQNVLAMIQSRETLVETVRRGEA